MSAEGAGIGSDGRSAGSRRVWGAKSKGSHPAFARMPLVGGGEGHTPFACCPCRINPGDMRDVFAAMVMVQDPEWVFGLDRAADAGFLG